MKIGRDWLGHGHGWLWTSVTVEIGSPGHGLQDEGLKHGGCCFIISIFWSDGRGGIGQGLAQGGKGNKFKSGRLNQNKKTRERFQDPQPSTTIDYSTLLFAHKHDFGIRLMDGGHGTRPVGGRDEDPMNIIYTKRHLYKRG